jgi:hypothetical protein
MHLINKVRYAGSLPDKKPAKKRLVSTEEKLDEIGARLEDTPQIHRDALHRRWVS